MPAGGRRDGARAWPSFAFAAPSWCLEDCRALFAQPRLHLTPAKLDYVRPPSWQRIGQLTVTPVNRAQLRQPDRVRFPVFRVAFLLPVWNTFRR